MGAPLVDNSSQNLYLADYSAKLHNDIFGKKDNTFCPTNSRPEAKGRPVQVTIVLQVSQGDRYRPFSKARYRQHVKHSTKACPSFDPFRPLTTAGQDVTADLYLAVFFDLDLTPSLPIGTSFAGSQLAHWNQDDHYRDIISIPSSR